MTARVKYDLRLLESFAALAEELHFGHAAERLAFAQPALSQQIRRLEEQVGWPLFSRGHDGVRLTPAGEAFRPGALTSLRLAAQAADAARDAVRKEARHVTLAMVSDAGVHARPLLRSFSAKHREIELRFVGQHPTQALAAVLEGDVDAALTFADGAAPAGFERTSARVAEVPLGIALLASHALSARSELTPSDLSDQRLVMYPRALAPALHDLVLGAFGVESFASIEYVEPIGLDARSATIRSLDGGSVAVSAPWRPEDQEAAGVVFRPVAPTVVPVLWLTWHGVLTGPLETFVAFARRRWPRVRS